MNFDICSFIILNVMNDDEIKKKDGPSTARMCGIQN